MVPAGMLTASDQIQTMTVYRRTRLVTDTSPSNPLIVNLFQINNPLGLPQTGTFSAV